MNTSIAGLAAVALMAFCASKADAAPISAPAVAKLSGMYNTTILVSGVPVLQDKSDLVVSIGKDVRNASARYLVLVEDSGGTACPAMLQVVDLSGATPKISEQFGTCSDIPAVSLDGATLTVTLPDMTDRNRTAFIFNGTTMTKHTVGEQLSGPATAAGADLVALVEGQPVYNTFKLRAVANSVKHSVGPILYRSISEYSVGSKIQVTTDGRYAYGAAGMMNAVSFYQAAYVYGRNGEIWIRVNNRGNIRAYGPREPADVREIFKSIPGWD